MRSRDDVAAFMCSKQHAAECVPGACQARSTKLLKEGGGGVSKGVDQVIHEGCT